MQKLINIHLLPLVLIPPGTIVKKMNCGLEIQEDCKKTKAKRLELIDNTPLVYEKLAKEFLKMVFRIKKSLYDNEMNIF